MFLIHDVKENSANMTSWFYIVGAAKAATTSLFKYLEQHPEISMSSVKEPHYFSQLGSSITQNGVYPTIPNLEAYKELFAETHDVKYLGEASPSYLWDPNVALRIHDFSPSAKIIILLRDPIDRAYSHYLADIREAREFRTFHEALVADQNMPNKGWHISHLYIELGMYCEQVRRYIQIFGEEQVLVIFFEDFITNIPKALEQVYTFLEINPLPPDKPNIQTAHNPYATPRNQLHRLLYGVKNIRRLGRWLIPEELRLFVRNRIVFKKAPKPPIDDAVINLLNPIYEPDRACLEELLGVQVPWKTWK